jgi:hypothetical protein
VGEDPERDLGSDRERGCVERLGDLRSDEGRADEHLARVSTTKRVVSRAPRSDSCGKDLACGAGADHHDIESALDC